MSDPEQPLPKHLTDVVGTVLTSGNWYTHEHPHRHDSSRVAWDGSPINHTKSVSHRHEHCWQPQERHHHPVEEPSPSDPEEPR